MAKSIIPVKLILSISNGREENAISKSSCTSFDRNFEIFRTSDHNSLNFRPNDMTEFYSREYICYKCLWLNNEDWLSTVNCDVLQLSWQRNGKIKIQHFVHTLCLVLSDETRWGVLIWLLCGRLSKFHIWCHQTIYLLPGQSARKIKLDLYSMTIHRQ